MREVRVVLVGMGNVNRSLLHILQLKQQAIRSQYGITFAICGVADSRGIAISRKGFAYETLHSLKPSGKSTSDLDGYVPGAPSKDVVNHADADLLVEASPVNLISGEPGLTAVKNAIGKKWNVVLANKGPLVMDYDAIIDLANTNNAQVAFSATVCGGLPVINVLRRDLKTATLAEVRGIFNATSNFVLQEMEKGRSMQEAILEAQQIGAAETDPSLDISGQDTANKLYIIMKSATDFKGSIRDIKMEGIENVSAAQLSNARTNNEIIKLIATAKREDNQWRLTVRPESIPSASFLAGCTGWEMGIEIKTDLYESISMKNYEADPLGTAAAVLRDMIDIYNRH